MYQLLFDSFLIIIKVFWKFAWKRFQNGSVGRSWTHLIPRTQQIYNYIWNNSIRKGPENWINRNSATKGKRTSLRWGREVETQSHQGKTHTPATVIHNWDGSQKNKSFPSGARDLSSTPTPRPCTGNTSPQKIWLWKSTENMSRKTTELQGTENILLKGSRINSLYLKTRAKTTDWKAHGP